jgi:hypothetical protein
MCLSTVGALDVSCDSFWRIQAIRKTRTWTQARNASFLAVGESHAVASSLQFCWPLGAPNARLGFKKSPMLHAKVPILVSSNPLGFSKKSRLQSGHGGGNSPAL